MTKDDCLDCGDPVESDDAYDCATYDAGPLCETCYEREHADGSCDAEDDEDEEESE